MPNIPGAINTLPGAFTDVITQSRGVAVPGGSRLAAVIGEGSTDETLVSQASGGGVDGLNSSYSSVSGADGRHFRLASYPLVSNRTTLLKNGIPLVGLEASIDSNTFNNKYDYRIDITTGKIELQRGHLLDQGGSYYVPLTTNVGDGYIGDLSLQDVNAQPETWTIRCVSVQRNALNQPIAGTAKFLAFGSISGSLLDSNGNPVMWQANGVSVNNGILKFGITETRVSGSVLSPFRDGDAFTIKIASGVLVRGDSLTANFIPTLNLNDPYLTQGMNSVVERHGLPSVSNNLSLGAQLAYANAASALITVQAAPAMPRRTSYVLDPAINSTSTNVDEFIFPLPLGVTPDLNSSIHFFVTNTTTNVETQILPNKLAYYKLDTSGYPTTSSFIFDDVDAPSGYSYSYTVKQSSATLSSGYDGYIGRDLAFTNKGVFSSSTTYDASYVGKTVKIIEATNTANINTYTVTAVNNGKLYLVGDTFADFNNQSPTSFQIISKTTDLPITDGSGVDGTLVKIASTGTAVLTSALSFGTLIPVMTSVRLRITGSTSGNNGLYDITSVSTNSITIRKAVVNESNLRYEVLDTSDTSNYIVINHNVVPNGNTLRVSIIDSRDASFYDAGWVNAITSLEAIECDIVVPLPKQTISVIFQNALAHCKSMSNIRNKKERVLFMGAINGLTAANLTGARAAAVENIGVLEGIQGDSVTEVLAGNIEDLANYSVSSAFGNTFRCVYFYPDQIVVQAGTENVLIDGFYIAAAAAGYESADVRIENPLTNKVISGFSILRNRQFSTLTLEQLARAGVTTLQPVSGGGRVVWGLTTSQSGFPEEQEISIVFIRDRIAKTLRAGFAGFIGSPESQDTQAILNTRAVILLNSLVSQGLITAYKDLAVVRDSVDPTQWNVSVRCQPTYPINFIYIRVSLGQL